MKWPESVPVIEPGDVCKGKLREGRRRCAMGWVQHLFPTRGLVTVVLRRVIGLETSVADWNDHPRRRLDTIARALNRTTALLGYTEGNPEADWAARNRHRFTDLLEDVK